MEQSTPDDRVPAANLHFATSISAQYLPCFAPTCLRKMFRATTVSIATLVMTAQLCGAAAVKPVEIAWYGKSW